MENKDEVRIDLLLAESNDIEKGCYRMEFPVVAFTKITPDEVDFFIDTLLKYICQEWTEWEDTKKSLENLKEEIKKFLNREKWYFTYGEYDYSLKTIPLKEPVSSLRKDRRYPYIDLLATIDSWHTNIAYGEGKAPLNDLEDIDSIPLVMPGNWPGLSINEYMPFTIKDNRLYMFDWDGNPCGGPYMNAKHLLGEYYAAETEDGKKFIVDLNGKIFIDDVDEYDVSISYDMDDNIDEIYGLYSKNGKWGFFTPGGDVSKPLYDNIITVQVGEDGKYWAFVSVGDQDGYATYDKDFEPFPERNVDYDIEDGDEDLPF